MPEKLSEISKKIDNQNYYSEYKRIEVLFSQNEYIQAPNNFEIWHPAFSFRSFLNEIFTFWDYGGKYINVDDFEKGLNIDKKSMTDENFSSDKLLTYIQYIINAILFIIDIFEKKKYKIYISDYLAILKAIMERCDNIIESMGYSLNQDEDSEELYLVEKDSHTTVIAEKFPNISHKVIEYRRFDLKGNIDRKTDILCALWHNYEPIRKKLQNNNMNELDGLIGVFSNKGNIRHNNVDMNSSVDYVKNMSSEDFEKLCDTTYDLFLTAFMYSDFIDKKSELTQLKRDISG